MLDPTLVRLRAEILGVLERPDGSRATLLTLVDTGVAEAREAGMEVAQVIIRVKGTWDAVMAEYGDLTDGSAQRLRQDLVTRVIEAYYVQ